MKPRIQGDTCPNCKRPLIVVKDRCFVCGHPTR